MGDIKTRDDRLQTREENMLPSYLRHHLPYEQITLKRNGKQKLVKQKLYVIRSGSGVERKMKSEEQHEERVFFEGTMIWLLDIKCDQVITALESLTMEVYDLEDVFLFLEKERLAHVFWLELFDQYRKQVDTIVTKS